MIRKKDMLLSICDGLFTAVLFITLIALAMFAAVKGQQDCEDRGASIVECMR